MRKFEKHLLDTGRNYTTVGMRCRAIRSIMNDALTSGIIKEKQYPFGRGKFEIPTGQERKLALTLQQIKTLVTYNDLKTTENYLASFENEERVKNANALMNFGD